MNKILLMCLTVFITTIGHARTVSYSNDFDKALTIHKISTLPIVDNVDGIYSSHFTPRINELLKNDLQWDHVPSNFAGTLLTTSDLIKNPKKVQQICKSLGVDGVLLTEVKKNPNNMILSLNLFSSHDGRLVLQVMNPNLSQASTTKALEQLTILYADLKHKIPYSGLILSRIDSRVTVNVGKDSGVRPGQVLNISKIIAAKRHPKLGFLMSHEKALIGKVKILKVDRALSFADIISESEPGAIQKDSKIIGLVPVNYKNKTWINKGYLPTELALSENNKKLIGTSEGKWKPETPPTFGRLSASVGIGPYKHSVGLSNGNTLNSKNAIYPSVNLVGEAWINPEWYVQVGINQGTADIANPLGDNISASSGQYSLDVGYNLLLLDDFWNSKLYAAIGLYSFDMTVDQVTGGLSSTKYKGTRITLGGKTPIDDNNRWVLGGALYWYLNPKLTEEPFNSGSSDSRIVHFTFMLDHRWSERVWLNGELDFRTFTSDFSGGGNRPIPATQSSQRFTNLNFGVSYMF